MESNFIEYINQKKNYLKNSNTKELIGHKKKIHTVAWNNNGKKLASGSVDQTISIWSVENRIIKDFELKGHTDSVDQLCWNPKNSDQLASVSIDKSVRIWDIKTKNCIANIATPGENINVAWSPDSNYIAVGNKEDQVVFIDTRKQKIMRTTKFNVEVNELGWNHDNTLFFITTGQGTVQVTNVIDYKAIKTISAHTSNIFCIEFDPLKKYFAVGGADALVSLWDINEFICIRTFASLEYPIRSISFSYDGQLIALASEDTFIDISHVETGEQIYTIQQDFPMNTLAWHPKELILAYAGDEKDKYGRDAGSIRILGFKEK
jgi:THO complex subunit 3